MRPFKIIFRTDNDEVTNGAAASTNDPNMEEQNGTPGGIIGFSLNYNQVGC